MRLASKFLLVLTIGAVMLLGLFALTSYESDQSMLESIMERDAVLLGTGLSSLFAEVWTVNGERRAMELLSTINQNNNNVIVRWVWFDAEPGDPMAPCVSREHLVSLQTHHTLTVVETAPNGDRVQRTYTRVNVKDGRAGGLEITERFSRVDDAVLRLIGQLAVYGGSALLIGGSLIVLLGDRWVAQPLRLLIDKMRRVGRGDLSRPLALRRRDEFGELANAIDEMCDRLQAAQIEIEREHAARIATLEQLRHEDRLRTVGQLASGIAHELGTPLNVINGRAALIASGKLSPDDSKLSAAAIKAEAERMTKIIRQLLDFARRSRPQKICTDVRGLIRRTLDLLTPLAEKHHCHLTMPPGEDACLPADPNQLQQVLTNLVVNAIQAMPDGGSVQVLLTRLRGAAPPRGAIRPGEFLRIDVLDEGTGIEPEHREQLFEPFFTTKDVGVGTGLGLSIANSIVQEHGGWIDVQSDVGRGSCFRVFLPMEDARCAATS
jgi:two-component system NtrC family sensor kinase